MAIVLRMLCAQPDGVDIPMTAFAAVAHVAGVYDVGDCWSDAIFAVYLAIVPGCGMRIASRRYAHTEHC